MANTRISKYVLCGLIVSLTLLVFFNIKSIVVAKELRTTVALSKDEQKSLLLEYETLVKANEELHKDVIRIENKYSFVVSENEDVQSRHTELLVGLLDVKEDLNTTSENSKNATNENASLLEKINLLEAENASLKSLNMSLENSVVVSESIQTGFNFTPSPPINQSISLLPPLDNKTSLKRPSTGWFTMEATYYGPDCKGCTGITKTGLDVRETIYSKGHRIIAVDPSVIKLGSIIEVQTPNESFKAVAGDIGGDIKRNRIDILVASEEFAKPLGRHNVQMRILE